MKVNIYFENLKEEIRGKIIKELERELKEKIEEAQKANPDLDPKDVAFLIIYDHINRNNFGQPFEL